MADSTAGTGTSGDGEVVPTDRERFWPRIEALRDALRSLDGHSFSDTAHDRVRRLLLCAECGHLPEQHEDDGRGICTATIYGRGGFRLTCECICWEAP